ncbi:hypothetical protein TRSC58_04262 [Trypanosoma rangeli SC58]|uniref:Uncharacterized protein n=1 Tax=Trypanosoma rangeli SC58 TaxID=429131 RepID=A0A061IY29_TRYRA|nr:hypothetical protein TRSC58_04262 [Trypanosoma rangeli SC58]
MPQRPHSPLCTHSAPSLPEPLQSDILYTPRNAHAGHTCTDKGRRCASDLCRARGQWTDVGPPDLRVPLDRQQTTAPYVLRPPYLRGQIAPAACSTGRATNTWNNAISVSVIARVDSAREKRVSFTEAAPATKTASTTIKGSASPVEKKEGTKHDMAPLPNALTAYEAALAEYGTKLLSMTRRRKRAEHQQSRERLSRQKAVNNKYSDLSRPQVVTGSRLCVSSASQAGGNAAQPRECGDSGLVPGAIASSCAKARKADSDMAAMRGGPDKRRRVKPATSLNHPCCSCKTDVSVGTPHARVSSQNKDVTGASASSESVSVNIEIGVDDGGATATRCGCGTGDASACSSRRRDGWAQTDSSSCVNSCVTLLSGRRQAPGERGAKVAEDTPDIICLVTPPHLTPPRPLRRAYSSGAFTSCMSVESRKKKGTFSRIFPTPRVSSASVAGKSLDIDGWDFPLRTRQPKSCATGQKAFVFIRPQPEPRPLSRCHELRPYCDDKMWYMRDGLLSGGAWDDDGSMNAHRFSLLESCGPRWRRDGDIQRSTFTNIVPQYELDEFARRCQLRRAWRRWRQRLWAVRVHPPARFHDPEFTAGEGGGSRWAGLMTWMDELRLPSTLQ